MSFRSDLDAEMESLGLVRPGPAARAIGISYDALKPRIDSGAVRSERVRWRGHSFRGIPRSEVERLAALIAEAANTG